MKSLRAFFVRIAGLFNQGRRDRDLDAELDSHLQLHVDDEVRRGLSADEARRVALLNLGGIEQTKERYRDRRGIPLIETLVLDVRYAVRVLLQRPGFTCAVIAVLALGIGANSAIFSVVNGVLLRPLPYRDPGRLVQVWHVPPPAGFPGMTRFAVSPANYEDWERQNHVFEHMAIIRFRSLNISGTTEPEMLRGAAVSKDFFNVFGMAPFLGRTFAPDEDAPGHNRVVILGEALWTRRFGADRTIVGRTITLNGEPYTVVGVASQAFQYPGFAQLWTPMAWTDKERAVRDNHNCMVVARLKPDVDMRQAQAEMDTISRRLELQYPVDDKGWGAVVIPMHEGIVEDVRPTLLVLFGAVAFVLLVACANVANLVLVRTLSRRKEIAVRLALGASAGRILRQILCETVLLAVAGGALGLLLAHWGVEFIVTYLGDALPASARVSLDALVLAFTLALSVATGLFAGLGAAWRLTHANLNDALRQGLGRAGSDGSATWTRTVLVASEVALSLVLLVGAGLMIRSMWLLQRVDAGIDPDNVLTMSIVMPQTKYEKPEQQLRFYEAVLERVRALPGVESAGLTTSLPLTRDYGNWPVAIEGKPAPIAAEQPQVQAVSISMDYLTTLRVPVLRGRGFDATDTMKSRPVILVSESMASRFWPDEDPIGKRLTTIFLPDVTLEVVGIIGNVMLDSLEESPRETMYLPLTQQQVPFVSLAVRSASAPETLAPSVVRSVRAVDPDQPVTDIRTMPEVVSESLTQRRFTLMLIAAFAGVALVLAAVGIYSVLSYTVRQRVREIGIRMALGARAGEVLRLVVLHGLKPTLAGVAIGVVGAIALARVLTRFVYGVSPTDPATLASISLLVVFVGFVASLLPAYRATRVEPIRTLREE
jgi:predicted permease